MKRHICSSVIILAGLASIGRCAENEIAEIGSIPIEYLSECKLDHGIVELPAPGSPKFIEAKGYIFNFAKREFAYDPLTLAGKRPNSVEELRQAIIEAKTGDLYIRRGGDVLAFVAVSGRIQNLGQSYLYQFSGKELPEPEEAVYTENDKRFIGAVTDVSPGNCYLMQTLEGDLVLFRLVSLAAYNRSVTIQWIKKARGERAFDIPKGVMIKARAMTTPRKDAKTAKELEKLSDSLPAISTKRLDPSKAITASYKDVESYLFNRKDLISVFMNMLAESPSRNTDLMAVMIYALGEMRAVEAAPLLASLIDTHVEGGSDCGYSLSIDSTFGCVPALVKIGKPAAAVCLEAIALLPVSIREKRPDLEWLLRLVMLRVEGKDVTRLLLEQRKAETSDPEQIANLDRAISMADEEARGLGPAPPRPKIEQFPLTPEQAIAVQMPPEPTSEKGMSPLAYILIGVAIGVGVVTVALLAKKKLSNR